MKLYEIILNIKYEMKSIKITSYSFPCKSCCHIALFKGQKMFSELKKKKIIHLIQFKKLENADIIKIMEAWKMLTNNNISIMLCNILNLLLF